MASRAQRDANRQNGKLSTGPKTLEGKSASSRNAIKHGLTAELVVIAGKNLDEFENLKNQVEKEFQPHGWRESELVERIVIYKWRLRRTPIVEAEIFAYHQTKIEREQALGKLAEFELLASVRNHPYLVGNTRQELEEVLAEAEKAERSFRVVSRSMGAAFTEDARSDNAFSNLSRYETSLERSLRQLFVDLERLQAKRKGKHGESATRPVTIDMTPLNGDA